MLGQACRKGEAKSTYGTGEPTCSVSKHAWTSNHFSIQAWPSCSNKLCSLLKALFPLLELQFNGLSLETVLGLLALQRRSRNWLCKLILPAGGVYFAPAFIGLFAPWWRDNARGVCIGITRFTSIVTSSSMVPCV